MDKTLKGKILEYTIVIIKIGLKRVTFLYNLSYL